ncbi:hypothetical protein F511_11477 [Dorcoceras hygrometricum]|uniref:SANTA domain-containing protein n=1 Tax=Dorcoceras hygrometricum TaxID=472368 RepID=A0A2Z7D4S1_9LAMI|nr:hypothetical protein F511_11477 [Dorcoceras hygrometricum]
MASTSTTDSLHISNANKSCSSIPKSRFMKTVCLSDWWLLKAENDSQGGGLSVSGFTSREGRAMRVFSSAPILKSHDIFTLETTDGIFVLIKGFINKARTLENGFPSDVFNHFVFGFPPYWKKYAEKCLGGHSYLESERGNESQHEIDAERNNCKTKSSPVILPTKCDDVIASFEDNNSVFSTAPVNFERTFSGIYANGDHMTVVKSVNCSVMKESSTSLFGGHGINSPDGGILSACHLTNENRSIKGRATPVSRSKMQRKLEKNQISNSMSGGYRTRSKSALSARENEKIESVNFETRDRNILHCGGIGFKEPMQMSQTPNEAKDLRLAETKGSMDQAIDKTMSQDWHSDADNEKEHANANEKSVSEDNTSVFPIAPVNLETADHMTADRSVSCSTKKASTASLFGEHAIISPDGGIPSSWHLTDEDTGIKGKETPESCSKLRRKHRKNRISNPTSAGYRTRSRSSLSACEKVRVESVNFEPRDRNNLHCGGIGFEAETKASMDQRIGKRTRSQDWHGAADNEKKHAVTNEISISEKDDMSKMKTKRKLAYPTVASETAFSLGKRVVDLFRSCLSPKMVEALVCAGDWLRAEDFSFCKDQQMMTLNYMKKLKK